MKARKYYGSLAVGTVLIALATVFPAKKASAHGDESHFVVASSMLSGLGTGTVFPFIDTTPQTISQAHVAITDATTHCSPGAAPPANVKILVGQAGVSLVPVMDASTNTGISTAPGQCVFHITIHAGESGVPPTVTDIVVLNSGSSPLSGVNTVTASATVRVDESASNGHRAGQAIEPEPICRADTRTPCFFLGFGKSSNVGFLVGGVTPVCLTGIENLLPTRHLLCY